MSVLDDDDHALAAEYVVGTLTLDERNLAEARRLRDTAFNDAINQWTERLAPLMEDVPALEPGDHVRQALMAEIDRLSRARHAAAGASANLITLHRQVVRWRVATAACAALAASLALWLAAARTMPVPDGGHYMAVLQKSADEPAFLVSLDLDRRRMTIVPTAAVPEPDKSFELWMIGSGTAAPRSLGVVDQTVPLRAALPNVGSDLISNATYAITLEPKGGSPNGKPSAAPIFSGRLVDLTPTTR